MTDAAAPIDEYTAAEATDAAFGALNAVRRRLREKRAELERRREHLEIRKQDYSKQNGGAAVRPNDKMKLNVGGVRVVALRETLTQFPETRLAALFSGRWENCLLRDKTKHIFLDVNPLCFRKILAYHQLCKIAPPDEPPELPQVPDDMHYIMQQQLAFFGFTDEYPKGNDVRSFKFQPPDDTSGVLRFIGMKRGTMSWRNPHESGQVVCTRSDGGCPQRLVGRSAEDAGWCHDASGKSIVCDLKAFQVKPTGYSLGHTGKCCVPCNWCFACSTDGVNYVNLHVARNEYSIRSCSTAFFSVTSAETFYRFFRLTCTGADQSTSECCCFHICNFELYGDLKSESAAISTTHELESGLDCGTEPESQLAALKAAFAVEKNALEYALRLQTRAEENFASEEAFVKYFTDGKASDIVSLNVSGDHVSVKRSTLRICEGSVLASKFDDTKWKQGGDDDDSDGDDSELIEHCSYCFGKIVDQMRLKRMFPEVDQLDPPIVAPHQRNNFERIVKYYFPGQESFIMGEAQGFAFQSCGDTNGVLHFIGTKRGTTSWQNPHESGQVLCTSPHGGCPQRLVGRSKEDAGWCHDANGKSIVCDLKAFQVKPTGYSLGHTGKCCVPFNWCFACSTDGVNYVNLHVARNEHSIRGGSTAFFLVMTHGETFYRFFRLTCTGDDQSMKCCCFHICNFELYGQLRA